MTKAAIKESKPKNRTGIEAKLGLIKTKSDRKSHIVINEAECARCRAKICVLVCPAQTYERHNGTVKVSYENCLECGSCYVICPKDAIEWQNPRGGFGVTFKNG